MTRLTILLAAIVAAACSSGSISVSDLTPVATPGITHLTVADAGGAGAYPTGGYQTDRPRLDLGGDWQAATDPTGDGNVTLWSGAAADAVDWQTVTIPGSINHQVDDLFFYAGDVWYRTTFNLAGDVTAMPVKRLRFEGVFRSARVWLNGFEVGGTNIPYLPFETDISEYLQAGKNEVIVLVNNQIGMDTLPSVALIQGSRLGWWKYNGIHRPVYIEGSDTVRVFRTHATTIEQPGGGYALQVDVGVWNTVDAASRVITIEWRGQSTQIDTNLPKGATFFRATFAGVKAGDLWSPGNPQLSELSVHLASQRNDRVSWMIGPRTITTSGRDILLNGEPYYMLGMNRHEDHPDSGPTEPDPVVDADLERLRDLGVNHVRTTHYPARQDTFAKFDAQGYSSQAEIPLYQSPATIMSRPRVASLAAQALTTMVLANYNHPSILFWSVGNENEHWIDEGADVIEGLLANLKTLDPSRPTVYVSNVIPLLTTTIERGIGAADVLGYNQYFGWFYGDVADLGDFLDKIRDLFPDKPVAITEWGAEAKGGKFLDGPVPDSEDSDDHSLSEDFQARYYEQVLAIYASRDDLVGQMPWVFADHFVHWKPIPAVGLNYGADFIEPWKQIFGIYTYDRQPKKVFSVLRDEYHRLPSVLDDRGISTGR